MGLDWSAIATVGALATSLLYLLGGSIVNIHLGKYRITEYQILSIDFLVVGIFFIIHMVGVFSLSGVIMFLAFVFAWIAHFGLHFGIPLVYEQIILDGFLSLLGGLMISSSLNLSNRTAKAIAGIIGGLIVFAALFFVFRVYPSFWLLLGLLSLISGYGLILYSARREKQLPRFFSHRGFWGGLLESVAFIFPLSLPMLIPTFESLKNIGLSELLGAGLGLAGAFMIIMYYAWEIYGQPIDEHNDRFGGGIGKGVPRPVRLVSSEEDMRLLWHLGVPLAGPEESTEVFLLNETDSHYIVAVSLLEGSEAIKISKTSIHALRYCGETKNEVEDESGSTKTGDTATADGPHSLTLP